MLDVFADLEVRLSLATPPKTALCRRISRVVAVSGAAALGKTSFCRAFARYLRSNGASVLHVELDGYLMSRQTREIAGLSGYNPRATHFLDLLRDLDALLLHGRPTALRRYDHRSGTVSPTRPVRPRRIVILDGITSLHHELRDRYPSFRVFLGADDLVSKGLRLSVDMRERDYSVFQALEHADSEAREYDRWIHHQRTFADLYVHVSSDRSLHVQPA